GTRVACTWCGPVGVAAGAGVPGVLGRGVREGHDVEAVGGLVFAAGRVIRDGGAPGALTVGLLMVAAVGGIGGGGRCLRGAGLSHAAGALEGAAARARLGGLGGLGSLLRGRLTCTGLLARRVLTGVAHTGLCWRSCRPLVCLSVVSRRVAGLCLAYRRLASVYPALRRRARRVPAGRAGWLCRLSRGLLS